MRKSNGQKPPKPVTEDDPEQSEAFLKAVADLEAAGELSPTDGEKALEHVLIKSRQKPNA